MKTIKDFIIRLRTEKDFALKYAKFDEEQFVSEANKEGYEFSKEDLNNVADVKVSISMEDLENVSGGYSAKELGQDLKEYWKEVGKEFDVFSDMFKDVKQDIKDDYKIAKDGIKKGGQAVGRFFKRIFS